MYFKSKVANQTLTFQRLEFYLEVVEIPLPEIMFSSSLKIYLYIFQSYREHSMHSKPGGQQFIQAKSNDIPEMQIRM